MFPVSTVVVAVCSFISCAHQPTNGLLPPTPSRKHIRFPSIHKLSTCTSLSPIASSALFPSAPQPSNKLPRNKHQLNYVDEGADADVELAFNIGRGGTSVRSKRASTPLLKHLFLRISKFLYNIKDTIRSRIERCTVYVLELEDSKYYVGSTTNRKRRIKQHRSGRGSKWTREHRPIRVLKEYRRIPKEYLLGMESKVTAEMMLEYGINNVRGSMFCSPREYHLGDVDALTKFLGHYNDLNYRKVNRRLYETLSDSPKRSISKMAGKCYCCGKFGHYAAQCPGKVESADAVDTDTVRGGDYL